MRIQKIKVRRLSDGATIARIEGVRKARYWELRSDTISEDFRDVPIESLAKATAEALGMNVRDIYLT